MGWTGIHATHYNKRGIDRKAECDAYFMEGLNRSNYEVLKSAMVGSVYYAAVKALKRYGDKNENGERTIVDVPVDEQQVFAVVFLTSVNNKDHFNFSYKDMDETCGPYQCDCPKGILDLLTPTDSEFANNWRERCYANLEKKKDKNSLSKLPIGSVIKYTDHNGKEITLYKHPAGYQFKRPFWMLKDNSGYISTRHISNSYEVVKRGE